VSDGKDSGRDVAFAGERVAHVLESVGASDSARTLMILIDRASRFEMVSFDEWESAFGLIEWSSLSLDDLVRLVLLLSNVVPGEVLREVLVERCGAQRRCGEVLVSDASLSDGVNRILRHDILYSFWKDRVLAAFDEGGVRSVVEVVNGDVLGDGSDERFSIAQNVLLALARERLSGRPSSLRELEKSFSNMPVLLRKIRELLLLAAGSENP
jgi:hypothetical protein